MADTAAPVTAEIAGTGFGDVVEPYIGELSYDPRATSGYRSGEHDVSRELLLYRDALRDERAYSALAQRLDAATAIPWEVQPGGSGPRDQAAADDLAEQLGGFEFRRTCRQMLFGVWYGYSVGEAIWGRDGGRVVLADLRVRAPDRFRWTAAGSLLLRSRTSPRGDPVPGQKFVVLTRPGESADVPHAPGLARWCWWPVFLKRNAVKFWAIALDKFGTPTAIGKHRRNANTAEKNKLLSVLKGIASGSGVALPDDQDISLLQSAARAGGDFQAFVNHFDSAMTTLILGQSSTTDQGPWRGTAEIQMDVRNEVIAADCALLDAALNTSVATWLAAWNHPGAAPPVIVHDASPGEDLDRRAVREEIVGRATGLRPTARHVEEVYGGKWEPDPASPLHGPYPGHAGAMQPALRRGDGPMLAAGGGADPIGQSVIDLLAGDGWAPMMEPLVQPILDAANAAMARGDSLEKFRAQIPEIIRRMDDTAVAEALHRTTFSAALSGQAGLES